MKKLVIASVFVFLLFGGASYAKAQNPAELKARIEALLGQIKALQNQVEVLQTQLRQIQEPKPSPPAVGRGGIPRACELPQAVAVGLKGDDVRILQRVLREEGRDVYPEGFVTGYFGPLSDAALKRFQEKRNLPATGILDEATKGLLEEKLKVTSSRLPECGPAVPPPPTPFPTSTTACAGPGLRADIYGGPSQQCCPGLVLQGGVCNVPVTLPPPDSGVCTGHGLPISYAPAGQECCAGLTVQNGYCLPPPGTTFPPSACNDSDGGRNASVWGKVSGGSYGVIGYNHGSFADYCNPYSSKVVEYFCVAGDSVQFNEIECASGAVCRAGACVPASISTSTPPIIPSSTSTAAAIVVISPNGGESFKIGTFATVSWKASDAPATGAVGVYLALEKWGDSPYRVGGAGVLPGAGGLPFSGSYNWNVGSYVVPGGQATAAPGATYRIVAVLYSFSESRELARDYSDNLFTLVSATAPAISSLSPASGAPGTAVTVVGSGFTLTTDIAFIGSTNLGSPIEGEKHFRASSADGKTLTVVVPSAITRYNESLSGTEASVIPGIYYFIVQTESGKSNIAYFTVTAVPSPIATSTSVSDGETGTASGGGDGESTQRLLPTLLTMLETWVSEVTELIRLFRTEPGLLR